MFRKLILYLVILVAMVGCSKREWTTKTIVIRNQTQDTIIYVGKRYHINTVNNISEEYDMDIPIPPYYSAPILTFQSDIIPSNGMLQVVNMYDYGKIIFNDSSYLEYTREHNYPKSPYTHLSEIEEYPNGVVDVYGYCVDEADHQYAIEHSGQE